MTTVGIFLHQVPTKLRVLEQITASLAVAGLSAAAGAFYFHACWSVAQLQHVSPDQLIRALTGV